MFVHRRQPLDPVGGTETPEPIVANRRKWLALVGGSGLAGISVAGYLAWKRFQGTDAEVTGTNVDRVSLTWEEKLQTYFPAPRDRRFAYGRDETDRAEAARYTNFYEFSRLKGTWRYVDRFQPYPWRLEVGGVCRNPFSLDLEELHREFADAAVERQYRHRCVERWAMAVPWTGMPLAALIKRADPLASATHVRFVSFHRPAEAPHQQVTEYPWPYTEGLTLPEATNELTLLATGMYGKPLLKQHGAPIRLVVPWKYGFKSIKSIERIEFVDREPATFWSTLNGDAYPFQANVEPMIPRPWPQHQERMLGTNEMFATQLYNGYGDYVAKLYAAA